MREENQGKMNGNFPWRNECRLESKDEFPMELLETTYALGNWKFDANDRLAASKEGIRTV